MCGIFGSNYYFNTMAVDSVVGIDVNPGIELSTNKNNRVLKVTAVNSDAEKVLDGMNLKDTDLKVAVNAIVGSMVQNGYLTDRENSILVTVRNKDTKRAEDVRNLILSDIDASLKGNNIKASVINQTVTDDETVGEFAKANSISVGKALFIQNLCAKDASLNPSVLAQMSLREIADLVTEKNIDIRDIVDYDADDSMWENIEETVEDANDDDDEENWTGTTISVSEAKQAALTHAGVAASAATFVRAELDSDDGTKTFDIEFFANGMEYDYEISAATGAVIHYESEKDD